MIDEPELITREEADKKALECAKKNGYDSINYLEENPTEFIYEPYTSEDNGSIRYEGLPYYVIVNKILHIADLMQKYQ